MLLCVAAAEAASAAQERLQQSLQASESQFRLQEERRVSKLVLETSAKIAAAVQATKEEVSVLVVSGCSTGLE